MYRAISRKWAYILSIVSGILTAMSMPGFEVHWLAWGGLVPLLFALQNRSLAEKIPVAVPFGLIWALSSHTGYPLHESAGAYGIMALWGVFYALLISAGSWMQDRMPVQLRIWTLPAVWAAAEWLVSLLPFSRGMLVYPLSQWVFFPSLHVLGVAGLAGLSFLLVLANSSLLEVILQLHKLGKAKLSALIGLLLAFVIFVASALVTPPHPPQTFIMAANKDLSTELDSHEALEVNKMLMGEIVEAGRPDILVWPQNEAVDGDQAAQMNEIRQLAAESGLYLAVSAVWSEEGRKYTGVLLLGPDGQEVGRHPQSVLSKSEREAGYTAGPDTFSTYDTPFGKLALASGAEGEKPSVIRGIARSGADILLLSVRDEPGVPHTAKSQAAGRIFRAAESRMTIAAASAGGISMIIDPYGRMQSVSFAGQIDSIAGETFAAEPVTLYSRAGDWFGILTVLLALACGVRTVMRPARRS